MEELHDSEGKGNMDSKVADKLKPLMTAAQKRLMSEMETRNFDSGRFPKGEAIRVPHDSRYGH